jgi:hypothetical protein
MSWCVSCDTALIIVDAAECCSGVNRDKWESGSEDINSWSSPRPS